MFELIIGTNRYSSKEDFIHTPSDLPNFAIPAFTFCKEWLTGQESFELQTSGSTGTPKPIQVLRSQMTASATATQSFFGITAGTEMLCCMNTQYIAGKMMLVRAIVWNCPILVVEPSSKPLSSLPKHFFPKFVAMVPIQVEESLSTNLEELKSLEHLIIGGAPVSKKLRSSILKEKLNAFQTYGMTETVSHVAIATFGEGDMIYKALPGVKIGQDSRGALWITSAMSNYQTIQTNDLVELHDDNRFSWLGRADFAINSGGIKFHPEVLEAKIESSIQNFFPNQSYFFYGSPDEKLGQKLILIIETLDTEAEKAESLREELKEILHKYEIPKEIQLIPEFIRTTTGKINRPKTIQSIK
ncbi:AMP-binding protein [Algoriphagus lutimaris]|uniref:AMP-binding protein n=1 Tax=Algoriphagus lutimaris TaxID=613197 RepID=UPI00196B24AC|nr:AMP-binding protein [Algoriphagus lutimaris]MBN3518506.1 AMP-binding protein [Algoriphagus lutimaris]